MTAPKRILVVDDSAVTRGLIKRVIDAEPDLTVVDTASNGLIAVKKVAEHNPDLVVLDVEMPKMDGLEALAEIRLTHKTLPVIMFSSLTERGADVTLRALEIGASDYVTKPVTTNVTESNAYVKAELVSRIRALTAPGAGAGASAGRRPAQARRSVGPARENPTQSAAAERSTDGASEAELPAPAKAGRNGLRPRTKKRGPGETIQAVIIGSSTGGPVALEDVVKAWTKPLAVPVFVVQHMPAVFTKTLADRLNRKSVATVIEAQEGMKAEAGSVYIAPGGHHMGLVQGQAGDVVVKLSNDPPENSCRPAVDFLFRSAADLYGKRLLAAMLTGMGNDGVKGSAKVAAHGCDIIAQDEATSVVWGMPKAVYDAGLATEVLSLDEIGPRLQRLVEVSNHDSARVGAGRAR
ncbi:MAG: chemotaxis response regulator protein-glutamate methylesterase [Actinomycetota bacterium]